MKKNTTLLILFSAVCAFGQPLLVKDINSGTNASSPKRLTLFDNNKFAFAATDSIGNGLYESDGTSVATKRIVGINGNTWIGGLGNKILFDSDPLGVKNVEPYVSDGTLGGTQLLVDIVPGLNGSFTKFIGTIGNNAYIYSAYGIYKTNGLPSGTSKMFQVSSMTKWIIFKNKIYFWGVNGFVEGLWVFDETSTQPTLINKNINLTVDFGAVAGTNAFYFIAKDSLHGIEPWISDGTAAGTHILKDIYPGITNSCEAINSTYNTTFAMIGNNVYFNPTEPVNGRELWVSDGTEGGTVLFKDIKSGSASGNPRGLISTGNKFYFYSGFTASTTNYLGVSDGTVNGTNAVGDSVGNPYELIDKIYKFNDKVFFNSRRLNGVEPYISDGTASGTFMTANIDATDFGTGISGVVGSSPVVMGNTIYFSIDDAMHGTELWKYRDNNATSKLSTLSNPAQFSIFPNPVSFELNIVCITPIVKAEIYNFTGIRLSDVLNKNTIDITNLNSGIYFLKVFTENGVSVQKFIKQ